MADYVGVVRAGMQQGEAFALLADASNFEQWDPGVLSSTRVESGEVGLGSSFDVTVKGPRPTTLRYRIVEFDAPETVVLEAESDMLYSLDRITVAPLSEGSLVTYEATLELRGGLRFADRLLSLFFKRIGDRAATGLREAVNPIRTAQGQ